MIIYKITNKINNKSYIGQTSRNLDIRWQEHCKNSKYLHSKLYKAMRKHGSQNFLIKIICKASSLEELNSREKFCIRVFNSIKNGYNSQIGGQDHTLTEEIKLKISISIRKLGLKPWAGKALPESIKQKISKTKKTKKQSVGKNNPMFGKKHSVSSILKNAKTNGSKEFQVIKNNVIIGKWVIKAQCARDLGLSREQVRDCLKGRIKSSNGYVFKYLED